MEVWQSLASIRVLLRIGGVLRTFESNFFGKCIETLKLSLVVIGPFSALVTISVFLILHADTIESIISAIYNVIGFSLAILVYISMCWQSKYIQHFFDHIDSFVNESE